MAVAPAINVFAAPEDIIYTTKKASLTIHKIRGICKGRLQVHMDDMKKGSKVYITNPWETLVYECTSTQVIYPAASR